MFKKVTLFIVSLAALLLVAGQDAQAVSTNSFRITDYAIDYTLGRDESKRSVLTTKETITARFPQANINHGLERAIPTKYDGHSTKLKVVSVTDQNGRQIDYSTSTSSGNKVLRIGDADKYVHGLQTYVITYTQRDVTKFFSNTDKTEFYWDTNGTDWRVATDKLTVSVVVDDDLQTVGAQSTACYQGVSGSGDRCELVQNGNKFTASAANLRAGENITLAIGFNSGTFAEYEQSLTEKLYYVWLYAQVALAVISIALIVWLSSRYNNRSNRTRELGTIVPEYVPPKDTSVNVAASILPMVSGSSFAALLIDLSVRHYIKIYEIKAGSFLKSAQYELEIIKSIDDLLPDEREVLTDIFDSTAIGSRLNLKKMQNNTKTSLKLSDNPKKLKKLILDEYNLRAKDPEQSRWFARFAVVTLIAGIILLSPILLLVSFIAFIMKSVLSPLTDKGLALVRYLKGLRLYISVAEEERLRMLQSPDGAAKVSVGENDLADPRLLVKLYERTLPYAILFNCEKEWSKRIGNYYESAGTQPDWYSGMNSSVFSAAVFTSAVSSFSTVANYSTASSSSSGGSSGGGFSGGGGGGGGGGGW